MDTYNGFKKDQVNVPVVLFTGNHVAAYLHAETLKILFATTNIFALLHAGAKHRVLVVAMAYSVKQAPGCDLKALIVKAR